MRNPRQVAPPGGRVTPISSLCPGDVRAGATSVRTLHAHAPVVLEPPDPAVLPILGALDAPALACRVHAVATRAPLHSVDMALAGVESRPLAAGELAVHAAIEDALALAGFAPVDARGAGDRGARHQRGERT